MQQKQIMIQTDRQTDTNYREEDGQRAPSRLILCDNIRPARMRADVFLFHPKRNESGKAKKWGRQNEKKSGNHIFLYGAVPDNGRSRPCPWRGRRPRPRCGLAGAEGRRGSGRRNCSGTAAHHRSGQHHNRAGLGGGCPRRPCVRQPHHPAVAQNGGVYRICRREADAPGQYDHRARHKPERGELCAGAKRRRTASGGAVDGRRRQCGIREPEYGSKG